MSTKRLGKHKGFAGGRQDSTDMIGAERAIIVKITVYGKSLATVMTTIAPYKEIMQIPNENQTLFIPLVV